MGQRKDRPCGNGNAQKCAADAFQPGATAKLVFQPFQFQGAYPIRKDWRRLMRRLIRGNRLGRFDTSI